VEILLWVDALCIDQNAVSEKSQQVSLMADIFRQADNVVVWLGKPDSALEHVIGVYYRRGSTEKGYFEKVARRSYFERLWICQELGLARYVNLFDGLRLVPWEGFSKTMLGSP
jgi:hypothetical protein